MGRVPIALASIAFAKELIFCNAIANAQCELDLRVKEEKVKPLILRHPEQVLARPVSLMRWFQSEQLSALLRVSEENLKGKTTNALALKSERHPTCNGESKVEPRQQPGLEPRP